MFRFALQVYCCEYSSSTTISVRKARAENLTSFWWFADTRTTKSCSVLSLGMERSCYACASASSFLRAWAFTGEQGMCCRVVIGLIYMNVQPLQPRSVVCRGTPHFRADFRSDSRLFLESKSSLVKQLRHCNLMPHQESMVTWLEACTQN